MGSDRRTEGADRELVRVSAPECFAVFDIFLQHLIAESGVTEAEGSGKIDSVCLSISFMRKLFPFLEPRALPSMTISPSDTATTGLIAMALPRNAVAAECGRLFSDIPVYPGHRVVWICSLEASKRFRQFLWRIIPDLLIKVHI